MLCPNVAQDLFQYWFYAVEFDSLGKFKKPLTNHQEFIAFNSSSKVAERDFHCRNSEGS